MTQKLNQSLKRKGIAVAVLIIALFALVLFVMNLLTDQTSKESDLGKDTQMVIEGNQEKPDELKEGDSIQVDLVEYIVYNLDELDFQFVIARIRVKADHAIHMNLSRFVTSENIYLNEVDDFVVQLESKALFLGKQNVWFEIVSKETVVMTNIFIPVQDKKLDTVSLSVDFGTVKEIQFDLKKPSGTIELLSYKSDDVITDGKTYQMKVSNAYMITGDRITRKYPDGYTEEYLVPSTAQVHAFDIEAVSLWGDEVVIESALYTVTATGETFEAFNEQFSTQKSNNLMNTPIMDTGAGVLFFETLNPGANPIQYKGVLKLKIKGQSNYIIINVDL